jgi:hypothetical protein
VEKLASKNKEKERKAGSSAARKVTSTCAVTGSVHTPSMTPYLPITPDQIAAESIAAAEAGASIIHLHARDPEDGRRWSKAFREAGRKRLAGDTAREASSDEVKRLRTEARQLMEVLAEVTLEEPELSPREVAVAFADAEKSFVCEAGVYRILKSEGLVTSPAFIVIKAADHSANLTTTIN